MIAHSTPNFLLSKFLERTVASRSGKSAVAYAKQKLPRTIFSFSSECAIAGYFVPSGMTEKEFDEVLALNYEIPFNRLYAKLTSMLPLSDEDTVTCARYVANVFRRSTACRAASDRLFAELNSELVEISQDPQALRMYAAKVSFSTGRAVSLEALKQACIKTSQKTDEQLRAKLFTDDLVRGTSVLAAYLSSFSWSVLRSSSAEDFVISDSPVLSRSFSEAGERKFGVGVAKEGTELFIPISPRRILRGSLVRRLNPEVNADEARDLNLGQILGMQNCVYSRRYDQFINDLVQHWGGTNLIGKNIFSVPKERFSRLLACA